MRLLSSSQRRALVSAARGAAARWSIAVLVFTCAPAFAEQTGADGANTESSASPSTRNSTRRELNLVPLVGGDSDVGVGVGEVGDWARLQPGEGNYRWRLESGAFITFKLRDENQLIVPFQDYYLLYSLRNWGTEKRWTVDIRGSFTDETTLKYYGLGNASRAPSDLDDPRMEYGRIHPTLSVESRIALGHHLFGVLGNFYTHNWLNVSPDSSLATDHATGSPDVRALLGDFGRHGVELAEVGIEYDTRDNEIVTRRGMYHALHFRYSPSVGSWLPYPYELIDLTLRAYTTPIPRWLTLSARVVGDALMGSPPFYELARFNQTPAIGGVNAIRGVPAQRYYGKVKVFGNLEARSELFPFHLGKKQFVLGTAAFFDAGRVWTELGTSHPELDGSGMGLKYGVGGGLRLQQGQTFVVRVDLAWSPDARPVGAYFAAGQIF
jgi:hypothetical protein